MAIGYEFTRGLRDYLLENKEINVEDFTVQADQWFEQEINKHISDRALLEDRKILVPRVFSQAANCKDLYEYNNSHFSLIAKELGDSQFFDLFTELDDPDVSSTFPQLSRIKERRMAPAFREDEITKNDVRDLLVEIEGVTRVNSYPELHKLIQENFKYTQISQNEIADAFNSIIAKARVEPKSDDLTVAIIQEVANRVYGRRAEFSSAFVTLSKSDYASLRAIYKKDMGKDYVGEDSELFKHINEMLKEENKTTNEILDKIEKLPQFRDNPGKAWGSFVPKVRLMLNDMKEYLNETYPDTNRTFISEGVLKDFNKYLETAKITPAKDLAEVYERCSDEFCDFCVSENNLDHNYAFRIDRSDFDLFMADPKSGFKIDSSINKQSMEDKVKNFISELDKEAPNEITTIKDISQGDMDVWLFNKKVSVNLQDIAKRYSNLEVFSEDYDVEKIIKFAEELDLDIDDVWIKENTKYPLSPLEAMYGISKDMKEFKNVKSDAAINNRAEMIRRFTNSANLLAIQMRNLNLAIRSDVIDFANDPKNKPLENARNILASLKVTDENINNYVREASAIGINTDPESALTRTIRQNRAKGNFDITDYGSIEEVNTQRYNLSQRNINFVKEYMNYDLEATAKDIAHGIDTINADVNGVTELNSAINHYHDLIDQRHNLIEQGNKKGMRLTEKEGNKAVEKDRRKAETRLRNLYEKQVDRLTKEWGGKIKFKPLSDSKWLTQGDIENIEKVYMTMLTSLKGTDLLMKDLDRHIDNIDKTLIDPKDYHTSFVELMANTENQQLAELYRNKKDAKIDVFTLLSYKKRTLDVLESTQIVEAREDLKKIEGNKKILMFESNYDYIKDNNIAKISAFLQENKDAIIENNKNGRELLYGLNTDGFILDKKEIEEAVFNSANVNDKEAVLARANRLRDTHKRESSIVALSDDGTILPYNEIRGDYRSEHYVKAIEVPLMEVDDEYLEMERAFRNKTPRDGESPEDRAKRVDQEIKHINRDYALQRRELISEFENLNSEEAKELLKDLKEESTEFGNEAYLENREAFATHMGMSNALAETNQYRAVNEEDLAQAKFMAKKLGIFDREKDGIVYLTPNKLIQSDYEDRVLVTISEGHDNGLLLNSLFEDRDPAKANFDRIELALEERLRQSFAQEMKNGGTRFDALCERADGTSVKAKLIDQFGKEAELQDVIAKSEDTSELKSDIAKLEQYIKDNNLDQEKIRFELGEYDQDYRNMPLFQIKDELEHYQKSKVPETIAGARGFFTPNDIKRTARSFDPETCNKINSLAELRNKKHDWLSPRQRSFGRWSEYKEFSHDYEFRHIFYTDQEMKELQEKAQFKTMLDFLNPAKHMLNFFRALAALAEVGAIITTVAAKAGKDRLEYYVGNGVGELLRLGVPTTQFLESMGEKAVDALKERTKVISEGVTKAFHSSSKIINPITYKELMRDSFSHLMKNEGIYDEENMKETNFNVNTYSQKCKVNLALASHLIEVNEAKIALGGAMGVDATIENENLKRLKMTLQYISNTIEGKPNMSELELSKVEKDAYRIMNERDVDYLKQNLSVSETTKGLNDIRLREEKALVMDASTNCLIQVIDGFERENPDFNMKSDLNTAKLLKTIDLDERRKQILSDRHVLKSEGRDFNIDRTLKEISNLYDNFSEINARVGGSLQSRLTNVDDLLKTELTPAERREKEILRARLLKMIAEDQQVVRKRDRAIENSIAGLLLMASKQGITVDSGTIEALYGQKIVSDRTRALVEKIYHDRFTKEGLEKRQREMDARSGKFKKNQLNFGER